jgi:hypothetical protein
MTWLRRHAAFALSFAVLAAMTLRMHARSPLGPGQDHHFHLLVAAINGMPSAHPVKALYAPISPLVPNTLVYFVAYPFEKMLGPVAAFQMAAVITVYLGFPLAVAYALARVGRPPWGALLAFPIVYTCNTWFNGGFYPFLSASGFVVIAIAEHDVMLRSEGRAARRAGVTCAVACVLTFLAHGHAYAWLMGLLAMTTLFAIARRSSADAFALPRRAARASARIAARSLLLAAPSVALFVIWYARLPVAPMRVDPPLVEAQGLLSDKLHNVITLMLPTRAEDAFFHLTVFVVLILGVLVLVRRTEPRASTSLTFEICLVVTAASFFVLPAVRHGQTIAQRQLDIALWLLPLVVFPSRVRWPSAGAIAVVAVLAFSIWRMQHFAEYLRRLDDDDYRGLIEVSDACKKIAPTDRAATLAFVNEHEQSAFWQSLGPQQSHETLAAVCGLETPVYDTNVYPHDMQPLRYRGRISAPVTILRDANKWYERPGLFRDFDLVLVKGWIATPDDDQALRARADLVAQSGDYQLWRRR